MLGILHSEYQEELDTQDKYLRKRGLARHEVYPDENSFFRALRSSSKVFLRHSATKTKGKLSHEKLRHEIVEEINYNLAKYKEFFHGMARKQITEELDFMESPGTHVGYESLMAASQVLKAR